MSRVLIVSSKSYEKARADGLCGKNLKEGFHSDDVFLLGYADIEGTGILNRGNNEYEFFYHQNKKKENRIVKTLKRLSKPEIDHKLVTLYENYIEEIIVKEKIDVLVAIYFPLETVVAVANIKRKNPNLKSIIYEVDSSTDVDCYLSRLNKYYIKAYIHFMKKIYKHYDYALIMNTHYDHVKKSYEEILKGKLKRIDSPVLLKDDNLDYDNRINRETINFFYTGLLNSDTYTPEPVLRFFECNKDKINWRLHFYTRGNCEEILKKASKEDKRISVNGYVDKTVLNEILKEADIFLSLSCDFKPNSIPSKVFEYFNANRPVIHFCEKENIFTREYMDKYPRGYVVYGSEMIDGNDRALDFIDKCLDGSLPLIDAKSVFVMNTPEYSADLIRNLLKNR